MTWYPTTAFQVKRAAVQAISALLPDVQVTYGHPGRSVAAEWVCIGDVSWASDGYASLGDRQKEERYSISLTVDVQISGGTFEAAEARAADLMAAIALYFRSSPFMAFGRRTEISVEMDSASAYDYPNGRAVLFTGALAVVSRL